MQTPTFTLATDLGAALLARGWQVTCAESCTGGGIAAAITDVAGSSAWFGAGFVTYSNRHKQQLLGVSQASLDSDGAVSKAVVVEMASGALRLAGADIAVAVSGIAGPQGGSPDKPVGTVWIAWVTAAASSAECFLFPGDRAQVRSQTQIAALEGLLRLATTTV
jgi:nicotinamide-nucleotide amidase